VRIPHELRTGHKHQDEAQQLLQISTAALLLLAHNNKQLEKALGEHRYLHQGKAIRQVESPSSVCQQFPYAPFNAMIMKISK